MNYIANFILLFAVFCMTAGFITLALSHPYLAGLLVCVIGAFAAD